MLGEPTQNRSSEVIYQVYPASFNDANGDGHGDLQGITQKLDYIKSLNVDAIWISPFFLSPEGAAGDGGYAISNYREIDKRFGTMKDFEHLLEEAHKRGLRVYSDFVMCHTSTEHEWFKKSQNRDPGFADRYVWHDGKRDGGGNLILHDGKPIPPNNWQSVFKDQCAWEYDETRKQFFLHHFNKSQPALNLNDPAVQDAVISEMKFWLDKGVDGLRLDALPFANYDPQFRDNPYKSSWRVDDWEAHYFHRDSGQMCQDTAIELVKKIRAALDAYHPPRRALGEVVAGRMGGGESMEMAAEYLHPKTGGDGLHTAYTQSLVQFWYQYPPADRLRDMIRANVRLSPDGGFCNNLGNHDFPRFATRMMNGNPPYELRERLIKQLLALSVALPGSFCMYNGEELGLTQARLGEDIPHDKIRDLVAKDCRDPCRTPMPWQAYAYNAGFSDSTEPYLPVPSSHLPLAVDLQDKQPDSILNFTRHLIQQRQQNPALSRGTTKVLDTERDAATSPIVAFVRQVGEQTVLCAFNMSDRAISFKPADFLDDETLAKLKVAKSGKIQMGAFGYSFNGLKLSNRAMEQSSDLMHLEDVEVAGHAGPHKKKVVFAADMLIADNHLPEAAVKGAFAAFKEKSPSFVNGEKSTIDESAHQDFLRDAEHYLGSNPQITPGGATACTLRTLKELLQKEVDINLMGLAADDVHGQAIKKFLKDAHVHLLTEEWPEGVKPETAVSHIINHPNSKPSIITYPGRGIEALHKVLEKTPHLLEEGIRKSDIVYLPESTVAKFGLPFFHKLLESRWRNRKELVLALPTTADFGPDDSARLKFLIPSCNVVMGNDVEFARILDQETIRPVSDEQMARVTDKLRQLFRERVLEKYDMPCSPYGQVALITRGDKPALLVTEDKVETIPLAKVEDVRNQLGAGYATFAGFLAGYIKGLDHEQSASIAMGLAAEKIQQDAPAPYIEDPKAALKRQLLRKSMTGVASAFSGGHAGAAPPPP